MPCFVAALHRMGKHMEDCIVAAYTSLLVGTIIQDDSVSETDNVVVTT